MVLAQIVSCSQVSSATKYSTYHINTTQAHSIYITTVKAAVFYLAVFW